MRVRIYSCLLAFALGCNVTAEIIHEERQQVSLPCPEPVEGTVTWSRERDGDKVDLITADGDREIRHNDPGRRYGSQADKSLVILRAVLSDSGRYFYNNEPAAELMVIPSGTKVLNATERTSVTLMCPSDVAGSDVTTWVRQTSRENTTVNIMERLKYSAEDKILTIKDVQPGDAGLYHCEGKTAVYLRVTKEERAAPKLIVVVLGVFLPLALTIFIVVFLVWRCRFKTRGGSNQEDHTYAIIQHPDPSGNKTDVSQPNELIYSLIKIPSQYN